MEASSYTRNNTDSKEILDGLVQFNSIQELWVRQPTYLIVQVSYLFGALMTFLHACHCKGRWPLLWGCSITHGLVVEALCFFLPADVADNYWHSQTPLVFLGGRLPLHIIVLYPCFYYQATAAVNKFKFSKWTEPFAVALIVLLMDLPYDIVCVKFVHWTWHDTDPNLFDRHYWVPWNSYFFHASFSASFTLWFHCARFKMGTKGHLGLTVDDDRRRQKWEPRSTSSELFTFLVASVLGTAGGTLVFLLMYHPLHDTLGIHSEVIFFILLATLCTVVWRALTFGGANARDTGLLARDYFLLAHLLVHFSTFLLLTIFGNPEDEISMGYHQQVGPCNETVQFPSAAGKLLTKNKYLCLENYSEDYFDFHCTPLPPPYARWYTICGTPFSNRAEYIVIATALWLMAAAVFGSIYFSAPRSCTSTHQTSRDVKAKQA